MVAMILVPARCGCIQPFGFAEQEIPQGQRRGGIVKPQLAQAVIAGLRVAAQGPAVIGLPETRGAQFVIPLVPLVERPLPRR